MSTKKTILLYLLQGDDIGIGVAQGGQQTRDAEFGEDQLLVVQIEQHIPGQDSQLHHNISQGKGESKRIPRVKYPNTLLVKTGTMDLASVFSQQLAELLYRYVGEGRKCAFTAPVLLISVIHVQKKKKKEKNFRSCKMHEDNEPEVSRSRFRGERPCGRRSGKSESFGSRERQRVEDTRGLCDDRDLSDRELDLFPGRLEFLSFFVSYPLPGHQKSRSVSEQKLQTFALN
jgi:hypothetical protein